MPRIPERKPAGEAPHPCVCVGGGGTGTPSARSATAVARALGQLADAIASHPKPLGLSALAELGRRFIAVEAAAREAGLRIPQRRLVQLLPEPPPFRDLSVWRLAARIMDSARAQGKELKSATHLGLEHLRAVRDVPLARQISLLVEAERGARSRRWLTKKAMLDKSSARMRPPTSAKLLQHALRSLAEAEAAAARAADVPDGLTLADADVRAARATLYRIAKNLETLAARAGEGVPPPSRVRPRQAPRSAPETRGERPPPPGRRK